MSTGLDGWYGGGSCGSSGATPWVGHWRSLPKAKAKAETEKGRLERELQECKNALDAALRERHHVEKEGKLAQSRIVEANQKLDEMSRALNEADASKKKLNMEGQDLSRQIEEAETLINDLGKMKISFTTQLDDTKALGDAESKDKAAPKAKKEGRVKIV